MPGNEEALRVLSAQLAARDERERMARLSRAEAAIPPAEELIMSGPPPAEFSPTPSLGPPGPGGVGPRQNLDPRFMGPDNPFPLMGLDLLEPLGAYKSGLAESRSYGAPGESGPTHYPAVQSANEAYRAEPTDENYRRRQDARSKAYAYAYPGVGYRGEATAERTRLKLQAQAAEAARQRRLTETFGTPSNRAEDILALAASKMKR